MERFAMEACQRLPLAEGTLRLFDYVCQPAFLEEVFQRHRGRCYKDVITFPLFVQLIADALLEHDGSGRKSFRRAQETGALEASIRAVYGKLSRLPKRLSVGFFLEATARLRQVCPEGSRAVPASLRDMEVLLHDGKKLKYVAKRLKLTRRLHGQLYGGTLVVTQSLSSGMAVALGALEDGEANEVPLMPEVLKQLATFGGGKPRLHVGDRQYCDLNEPGLFTQQPGDHFVIRWNRKVHFHPDATQPARGGTDRYGRSYVEDWGWIGRPTDPRRRAVRRLWLQRPGQEDVIVLTDLLEAERYPADDLLEVYLQRRGIEWMFQKVSEVFHLKKLIGATALATLFQAAFCFLLYNMIQGIRAWIAQGQGLEVEAISSENLFYDVHRQLIAWNAVIRPQDTVAMLRTKATPAQVAHRLRVLGREQWSELWRKAPSNTHKVRPPEKKIYPSGGHTSVYRLMQQARLALNSS